MTQRGEQLTQEILQDLTCPQCQYNLRGLGGTVVNCPECGVRCDIAQLIAREWIGPWTRAPGYAKLLVPVAWLSIASLGVLIALVSDAAAHGAPAFATVIVGGGVLAVWVILLMQTARRHADGGALSLTLLTHALFVGYIGGVVGFIWGLVHSLTLHSFTRGEQFAMLVGFAAMIASVALLWSCRRGERFIAERCIREHLLQTMAHPVSIPFMTLTIDKARTLMHEWTQNPALRVHMECVAACMGAYAERLEPDQKDRWIICGLLHDFDYEKHPSKAEHPFVGVKHLRENSDVGEEVIDAILGHAEYSGTPRNSKMAQALFAVDELAGFIVACCKVRPNGIGDLEPSSVKKKLKDKAFAAAVSREDIKKGIAELGPVAGVDETQHIQICIDAIRAQRGELGL